MREFSDDTRQARRLERWLGSLLTAYAEHILEVNSGIAQIRGRLRVPRPEHALDKLIAATALLYDLTVVTRNQTAFADTGVRVFNPFSGSPGLR